MGLFVGDSDNLVLCLGANEVSAAYIGDTQVYPISPFSVSPGRLSFTTATLTANLRIKSPEAWTITDNSGGWLSYSASSGTAGVTVVTVTATVPTVERTATITVSSANYTKTVSVSQVLMDYSYFHLHNTSNAAGTVSFTMNTQHNEKFDYSYDTVTWVEYDGSSTLSVPGGAYIFFRGNNQCSPFYALGMDVDHTAGGNALSLLDKDDYKTMTAFDTTGGRWGQFNLFFDGDTHLTDVSELNWGLVTLAYRCFQYAFRGCTSLTEGAHFEQFTSYNSDPFYYVYHNCPNLNVAYAPSFPEWSTSATAYWLYNVAPTGIVVMDPSTINVPLNNTSGIPTGWTRVDSYYSVNMDATGANDYGFSYATSDGRSGTISVGDSATVRMDYPQTLSITTGGSKEHLCINGVDQGNGPSYSLDYLDLANGDTLTVIFDGEPS